MRNLGLEGGFPCFCVVHCFFSMIALNEKGVYIRSPDDIKLRLLLKWQAVSEYGQHQFFPFLLVCGDSCIKRWRLIFLLLESGLVLVTHLTNSTWWGKVLEFLRLGHHEPPVFAWIFGIICPWNILSQKPAAMLWKDQVKWRGHMQVPWSTDPAKFLCGAAIMNCPVYYRTTLDTASRWAFRWLYSQLPSTWDTLGETYPFDHGLPTEP